MKISELTGATAITANDFIPNVQLGVTKKMTVQQVKDFLMENGFNTDQFAVFFNKVQAIGTATQIQFADATGKIIGNADFTWNDVDKELTVDGNLIVTGKLEVDADAATIKINTKGNTNLGDVDGNTYISISGNMNDDSITIIAANGVTINGGLSAVVKEPKLGIDLSLGDYNITAAGIYTITTATGGGNIIFPDPSTLSGGSITIWNTDITNNAPVDNTNTFAPISPATGTAIAIIGRGSSPIIKSNSTNWFLAGNI